MRDTNNWIPNVSGECPVAEGTLIDVKYRDGETLFAYSALEDAPGRDTTATFWALDNQDNDIIAWRPHQRAEMAHGNDESVNTVSVDTAGANTAGINPKQSIGLSKLPLHLWSPLATAYGAVGLANGRKYGEGNYKATPILMSIYLAATLRHLYAFIEGQECDEVDGTPHIAAILANMAIILEARSVGTMIDDRPMQGGYLKEAKKLTEICNRLNELHKGRDVHHYTINDNPPDAIK